MFILFRTSTDDIMTVFLFYIFTCNNALILQRMQIFVIERNFNSFFFYFSDFNRFGVFYLFLTNFGTPNSQPYIMCNCLSQLHIIG